MRNEIWNEKCIISPSMISICDMCNLESSVRELENAGIEMLHVDILDGHFSPSLPLGLDTVRQLRELHQLRKLKQKRPPYLSDTEDERIYPWYHLYLPSSHDHGLGKCLSALLFCYGNSRCSLLAVTVRCTANRMNSKGTPPLSHSKTTALLRPYPDLLIPAQTPLRMYFITLNR